MCKIIAIANQKGGVAKTTTTINLGVGLSKVGKRVMLIDADPQGHLTMGLGFPKNLMATKLKQYSDEGKLTELAVQLILNEKKTETGKVTLTEKKIRKYFPKEYNREQIEQVIYELLDNWKKSQ